MSTSIHRLSDDLLLQIFEYHIPKDPYALPSTSEGPLFLGRICQRWRDLVYHTTYLWAVVPSMVPPFRPKITLERVQQWVGRAGNCGLTLALQDPWIGFSLFAKGMSMTEAITEATKWMTRWKDVVIELQERNCASVARALADNGGDLRQLRSLSMTIDNGSGRSTNTKPSWKLDLSGAPQLAGLRIVGNIDVILDYHSHHRLRTVRISDVWSHSPYFLFLTHFRSIETFELKVRGSLNQPPDSLPSQQIALPKLRTLRLMTSADPFEFLETLVLPELREFQLKTATTCRRLEQQPLHEAFGLFLQRGRTGGHINHESLEASPRGTGYQILFNGEVVP